MEPNRKIKSSSKSNVIEQCVDAVHREWLIEHFCSGYRSVNRDIEAQIAIVTENTDLQRRLGQERDRLFDKGLLLTDDTFHGPDHQIPWAVRLSWRWIKNFF